VAPGAVGPKPLVVLPPAVAHLAAAGVKRLVVRPLEAAVAAAGQRPLVVPEPAEVPPLEAAVAAAAQRPAAAVLQGAWRWQRAAAWAAGRSG
jgi:hypothetical protein